jgi:hypothetical protein
MAQHHFVVFYDDKDDSFYLDTWTDATGRDEGDIFDPDHDDNDEPWRFAGESGIEYELDINSEAWEALGKAIRSIPKLAITSGEEEDVVY